MPKPDDRSDNVDRIANNIQNTMANLRESEDFLKAHSDEMNAKDREALEAKNDRRERAIEGLREEIADESDSQQYLK
ncbi:small acid-soluble spore protein Tlp [Alicyclobacillus pomorum]|jgi:small acid-soluble spore protein (thioredoxin-like protein)|uniref:small acid-soluble spore protein Tlp n=1 Tax=Alicyclobacillus pomorum TaxID=204470 RepID=UPI0004253047|nr:small acid-soluble spore protein Tlp [Alicyclobacillus pomorum]